MERDLYIISYQNGGSLPIKRMRNGEVLNVGRNVDVNGGHVGQSGGSLPTESMRSGEVLNVGRNMITSGGQVSQSGGSSRTESMMVGKEPIVRQNGAHGMRLRKRVERSYMERNERMTCYELILGCIFLQFPVKRGPFLAFSRFEDKKTVFPSF